MFGFGFGLCGKIAVWFGSKFFVLGLVRFGLHFENMVWFCPQNSELVATLISSITCITGSVDKEISGNYLKFSVSNKNNNILIQCSK